MRVTDVTGGPVISNKFSPLDRVIGTIMLATAVALIAAVVSSPVYNFWTFSAAVLLTALMLLPGLYFALYISEMILDPSLKKILVRRGWIFGPIVADYDFSEIMAILSARKESGRPSRRIAKFQTILRVEEGGLVFSTFTSDESANAALADKLSRVIGKPVEKVREKEDGNGYVPE